MAFWILLSWPVFTAYHTLAVLAAVLVLALVVTFSPVLFRSLQSRQ
jgi:hypothetical protein